MRGEQAGGRQGWFHTVSVYSIGAIGRLMPDDVIGVIRYVREHAAAGENS